MHVTDILPNKKFWRCIITQQCYSSCFQQSCQSLLNTRGWTNFRDKFKVSLLVVSYTVVYCLPQLTGTRALDLNINFIFENDFIKL